MLKGSQSCIKQNKAGQQRFSHINAKYFLRFPWKFAPLSRYQKQRENFREILNLTPATVLDIRDKVREGLKKNGQKVLALSLPFYLGGEFKIIFKQKKLGNLHFWPLPSILFKAFPFMKDKIENKAITFITNKTL